MISAIIPANFVRSMQALGAELEFWDTTYMCAHRESAGTDLKFQRNAATRFLRRCGDHMLLLARRRAA